MFKGVVMDRPLDSTSHSGTQNFSEEFVYILFKWGCHWSSGIRQINTKHYQIAFNSASMIYASKCTQRANSWDKVIGLAIWPVTDKYLKRQKKQETKTLVNTDRALQDVHQKELCGERPANAAGSVRRVYFTHNHTARKQTTLII
jgi:hypothetical protein